MSDADFNKRQVWILENEKKGLIQQVERLEARLQEYVTWSEQAQKILDENKVTISQLESQNKQLSEKVNQGTVSMSNNLLDENSQLRVKFQELQEQIVKISELLNPLVMNNIDNLDTKIKKKIYNLFSKMDNEKRVIAVFIDNSGAPVTLNQISSSTRLSHGDCSAILKKLVTEDLIRETDKGVYQALALLGDKIISSRDLGRVSTEALHNFICEQIVSTIDGSKHLEYLDEYSNELTRRGETSLSRKIIAIKGELHMAKRTGEWIVEQIDSAISESSSVPLTSRQTQPASKNTSSRLYTSTYTTPDISSRNQFQNPTSNAPAQYLAIDTREWPKLSNADVIDNLKLQISDKMDYLAVVEGLNALRDHLSSSVGGRALYEINNMINQIKNKKSFEKNDVNSVLVELMTKV